MDVSVLEVGVFVDGPAVHEVGDGVGSAADWTINLAGVGGVVWHVLFRETGSLPPGL